MNYLDAWASVTALCKTVAASLAAAGISSPQVWDFDSHADWNELPDVDLVGPYKTDMLNDDKMLYVTSMFCVSTIDDMNLFRLRKSINHLYERLKPASLVPLLDAGNGNQVGVLKVMSGTQIMSVERTQIRPVQFIGASFGTDLLGP